MIDTVREMANQAGAATGAAIAINAHIAEGDLRNRERRLRASYKARLERSSVSENELPALQQVQQAAHQTGSQWRCLHLLHVRAESLAALGRTSEARKLLDDAVAQLHATPGATARGDATLLRAARKAIAD